MIFIVAQGSSGISRRKLAPARAKRNSFGLKKTSVLRIYSTSQEVEGDRCLLSRDPQRITYYISIAHEKAANATPPPIAALGPEFLARIAPVAKPAATGLTRSFFARYCSEEYNTMFFGFFSSVFVLIRQNDSKGKERGGGEGGDLRFRYSTLYPNTALLLYQTLYRIYTCFYPST